MAVEYTPPFGIVSPEDVEKGVFSKEMVKQAYVMGINVGMALKQKDQALLPQTVPPASVTKTQKVYHKSVSDEHVTPKRLYQTLDEEFSFDLDPAATSENHKAPLYYTKTDNGLKQDWFGRVWLNPPYTKGQVGTWLHKTVYELMLGRIDLAVVLVAAKPDTKWWDIVSTYATEIRFLKGRLQFDGDKWAAPFPSALAVFRPAPAFQVITFWDWRTNAYHAPWLAAPARVQRTMEVEAVTAWLQKSAGL